MCWGFIPSTWIMGALRSKWYSAKDPSGWNRSKENRIVQQRRAHSIALGDRDPPLLRSRFLFS